MSLDDRMRGLGQRSVELDESVPSDPALRASGVQARAERSAPSVPPLSVTLRALPLVSIGSPADPSLLEPTYAYLSSYCSVILPPQVAQRINVAIYELYGNALRYGTQAGEVRLELERTERGVRLTVTNLADAAQSERLGAQVAQVQADPDAAFSREMNRFGSASQ